MNIEGWMPIYQIFPFILDAFSMVFVRITRLLYTQISIYIRSQNHTPKTHSLVGFVNHVILFFNIRKFSSGTLISSRCAHLKCWLPQPLLILHILWIAHMSIAEFLLRRLYRNYLLFHLIHVIFPEHGIRLLHIFVLRLQLGKLFFDDLEFFFLSLDGLLVQFTFDAAALFCIFSLL